MPIQSHLQKLYASAHSNFSGAKFLLMFISVVIGPFMLLAVGGRTSDTLWQPGLVWTLLAIGLLFVISASAGLILFKSKSFTEKLTSIRPNFS
jgi:hypothetical protein